MRYGAHSDNIEEKEGKKLRSDRYFKERHIRKFFKGRNAKGNKQRAFEGLLLFALLHLHTKRKKRRVFKKPAASVNTGTEQSTKRAQETAQKAAAYNMSELTTPDQKGARSYTDIIESVPAKAKTATETHTAEATAKRAYTISTQAKAAHNKKAQTVRTAENALPETLPKQLSYTRADTNTGAHLAFVIMIVLLLLCALFFAYDVENMIMNAVAMTLVFIIVIITYFSSITVGLVINIVVIFAYATYLIVGVITQGQTVDLNSYFFMVISPALTISTGMAFRRNTHLETQNTELKKQLTLTEVDLETGLHTMRALERDLTAYRSIAERSGLKILIIVWVYRYPVELRRMLGYRAFRAVSLKMTEEAKKSFRKSDRLYLLSENRWAALTLSDEPDEKAILERLREGFDNKYYAGENTPRIDLKFGMATDERDKEGKYISVETLIERAEMAMEFDV